MKESREDEIIEEEEGWGQTFRRQSNERAKKTREITGLW
jgi:hypothetical protein